MNFVKVLVDGTKSFRKLSALSTVFRRLWIKGSKAMIVFAVVFLVIEAAFFIAGPNVLRYLIDLVNQSSNISWDKPIGQAVPFFPPTLSYDTTITLLIWISAALIVLTFGAFNIGTGLARNAVYYSQVTWSTELFAHIVRLPMEFHVRTRKADILKNTEQTVKMSQDVLYQSFFVGFLRTFCSMVFIFVVTYQKIPKMFYECCGVFLAALYVLLVFGSWVNQQEKKCWKIVSDVQARCLETMANIQECKQYCNEEYEIEERKRLAETQLGPLKVGSMLWRKLTTCLYILQALGYLLVMFSVLKPYLKSHELSVGEFAKYMFYWGALFGGLMDFLFRYLKVQEIEPKLDELRKVQAEKSSVVDIPNAQAFPGLFGEIAFQDVKFSYVAENKEPVYVLNGVNLVIPRGELVVFVGETGCGKSTMAYLLGRFYEPTGGRICVDGVDIRQYQIVSYRRKFAGLTQRASLYRKSVADNIAYSRIGASREQIVAAAKLAQAHSFISQMPKGYDTLIEENSANISGGQKQRIALARAILASDAHVVVLDEPTTGLDSKTARALMSDLLAVFAGKTIVVISHDPAIMRQADRVVLFSNGRVAQIGPHDTLVEQSEDYRSLVLAA